MKLKLQYFGYLMQRADLFEKTPVLGKIEGRRRREQQRMRWSNSIPDSMDTLLLLLLLSLFNHIKLSLTSQTAAHQAPPPRDSPSKKTTVGCHFLLQCMHAYILSRFSHVQPVQPHGQQPNRLLCPWDSPGKNIGVGCHCLLLNGHEFEHTPGDSGWQGRLACCSPWSCIVGNNNEWTTKENPNLCYDKKMNRIPLPGSCAQACPKGLCCLTSVQLLSHVRLFVTPWTAARQPSLSITTCWSLLKLMSI